MEVHVRYTVFKLSLEYNHQLQAYGRDFLHSIQNSPVPSTLEAHFYVGGREYINFLPSCAMYPSIVPGSQQENCQLYLYFSCRSC